MWTIPFLGVFLAQGPMLRSETQQPKAGISQTSKAVGTKDRIQDFEQQALSGNMNAAYCFGLALLEGDGVARDVQAGLRWMIAAADKEHPSALGHLGWIYSEGRLVPKDDARAFELYRRGAIQGDLYSQRSLGWAYRFGRGCERDLLNAKFWYEKAAERNDEDALVALGILHEYAEGLPKDLAKAAQYYFRAAELGSADAKCRLGWFFLNGTGVDKNLSLAFTLFRESAGAGWARSEGNLGYMYRKGLFVEKDPLEAMAWFRKSAEHGDSGSQVALAGMLESGEGGAPNLTEARSWYEKAVEAKNTDAMLALGGMYMRSVEPEDHKRAKPLFLEAAQRGASRAFTMVAACCLLEGRGAASLDEARMWAEKGVTAGDPGAKVFLGNLIRQGSGGDSDPTRARELLVEAADQGDTVAKWQLGQRLLIEDKAAGYRDAARLFQEATEMGFAPAKLELGISYQLGRGVPRNSKKALGLILEAAESGYSEAQFYLSGLYEAGLLVPRNKRKAKEWIEKAADTGSIEARRKLGQPLRSRTVVSTEKKQIAKHRSAPKSAWRH